MTFKFDALIVAAGTGSRMGNTEIPKQYMELCNKPLICHSLDTFISHPQCNSITIVISETHKVHYNQMINRYIKSKIPIKHTIGSNERSSSVYNGLIEIYKQNNSGIVLIHDAARPFLNHKLINELLKDLCENQAATLACPMTDTINKANKDHYNINISRDNIHSIQTPQAFRIDDIIKAHQSVTDKSSFTDDASIATNINIKVKLTESSKENIKITNQDDIRFAEKIALYNQDKQMKYKQKTAIGFDVHKFDNDKKSQSITLCNIKIPHHKKLKGHSDADVALHAITDAIYGCISAGDIGTHFPPSNDEYKDMDSSIFLKHAHDMVKKQGGLIDHIDLTIICEEPKISPHTLDMRLRISKILNTAIDNISIKATTTEGLGFTGRKEGIAAQAIALISIPEKFQL